MHADAASPCAEPRTNALPHARPAVRRGLSRRDRIALAALLGVFLALDFGTLPTLSPTYDEPEHLLYGKRLLQGIARRYDLTSSMPVSAWNALPGHVARSLPPGPVRRGLSGLDAARSMTIAVGVALTTLVFVWARALYGTPAGFLALTLAVLDPNLIAHSQLVTTDLYVAFGFILAPYAFWCLFRRPGWLRAAAAGAALGVALLAKVSAAFLVPALALAAALRLAWPGADPPVDRPRERGRRRALRGPALAAVLAAATLLVVNAGFLFEGTGTPLGRYVLASDLQTLAAQPVLGTIPLPLPVPFVQGLDLARRVERGGMLFGNVYLLGELREGRGFPGYYAIAYLFKVPLATQLLFLAALVALVRRPERARFTRDEAFLLLPVAVFWLYLNLFFNVQIGIRYLMPTFPLMHVFTASLLRAPEAWGRRGRLALGAALAWLAISTVSYFPHHLAYFNELVPDRRLAYRILADSNLDWGQSQWWLRRYLERRPDAIVQPEKPMAGTLVVAANYLTGVFEPERYRWLREHFVPVDHAGYSYLVFEVSPEALARATAVPPPAPAGH